MKKQNNLKQAAFLAAYAETGNLTLAALAAKCSRRSHHNWLKNPEYQAKFNQAQEIAVESMEAEARRRAVDGTDVPVFGSGGRDVGTVQVGTMKRYSDVLLIFLLKAANPKKYRDRIDHQHTGANGGPIQTEGVATLQDVMDEIDRREPN